MWTWMWVEVPQSMVAPTLRCTRADRPSYTMSLSLTTHTWHRQVTFFTLTAPKGFFVWTRESHAPTDALISVYFLSQQSSNLLVTGHDQQTP